MNIQLVIHGSSLIMLVNGSVHQYFHIDDWHPHDLEETFDEIRRLVDEMEDT